MAMKYCKYCGRDLPIEMFCRNKKSKDGRHTKCRDCQREYKKQRDLKIKTPRVELIEPQTIEEQRIEKIRRMKEWREIGEIL